MRKRLLALVAIATMAAPVPGQSIRGGSATSGAVTAVDSEIVTVATSGTVLEGLHAVTLPANSLEAVGDFFTIETQFRTAANANSKIARHYVGTIAGTTVSSMATTGNNVPISLMTTCRRDGASTVFCSTWFLWSGGNVPASAGNGLTVTGLTFTTAITLTAAGLTATAAGDLSAISTTLLITKF